MIIKYIIYIIKYVYNIRYAIYKVLSKKQESCGFTRDDVRFFFFFLIGVHDFDQNDRLYYGRLISDRKCRKRIATSRGGYFLKMLNFQNNWGKIRRNLQIRSSFELDITPSLNILSHTIPLDYITMNYVYIYAYIYIYIKIV